VTPTRAISVPFILDEEAFRKTALQQSGVLLDRIRLLGQLGDPAGWLDPTVGGKVTNWVRAQLSALEFEREGQ